MGINLWRLSKDLKIIACYTSLNEVSVDINQLGVIGGKTLSKLIGVIARISCMWQGSHPYRILKTYKFLAVAIRKVHFLAVFNGYCRPSATCGPI